MNPASPTPEPDPLRASPQPSPSEQSRGGSSISNGGRSSYDESSGEHRGQAYTAPPDFNQKIEEPSAPKPKGWMLPVVVALILAVGLGSLAIMEQGGGSNTPPMVATQGHNVLTVTGADVDQAATDRALAQLGAGAPSDSLLAALPQDVKAEILRGDRKFYRVPPQAISGQFQQGDKISIAFNGNPYGTYDLSQQPITISMPLKIGDSIDVKCESVAQGKSSLVVDLATVLNPVRTVPLSPGQIEPLLVKEGAGGTNYEWFEREAASGNAVAQYGLGHMYQYGLGVAQDRTQAISWYQKAAAQNYLDAKAQLQILQAAP